MLFLEIVLIFLENTRNTIVSAELAGRRMNDTDSSCNIFFQHVSGQRSCAAANYAVWMCEHLFDSESLNSERRRRV